MRLYGNAYANARGCPLRERYLPMVVCADHRTSRRPLSEESRRLLPGGIKPTSSKTGRYVLSPTSELATSEHKNAGATHVVGCRDESTTRKKRVVVRGRTNSARRRTRRQFRLPR